MWLAILIILVVLAVVGVPSLGVWNHSYGYAPSGIIGLIVVVLLILLLLGRL